MGKIMRLSKNLLASIKIRNNYDYAKGNPYIYYKPADTGRGGFSAAWCIFWPGHPFKDVPWYDHGTIAFDVYNREEKPEQLLKAQEKFKKIFNIRDLEKTPFGDYMDAEFVKARNEEIQNLLKNLPEN